MGGHNFRCHIYAFVSNYNFIGILWRAIVCLLLTYNLSNLAFIMFTFSLNCCLLAGIVQLQNNKM